MATPADLEDFGVGFAFTEGIIEQADEITSIEIVKSSFGIEIRMWLDRCRAEQLSARRRARKSVAGLRGATACSKQGNLSRARSVERHGQDPTLARAQRKDRGHTAEKTVVRHLLPAARRSQREVMGKG
ncbi:formate dehydrogenase accessory sulfurtransferase FdhD [Bradyrhizobium sp. S3.9.1]|uniref:formate dehydrogenase accessory sulfurtransferase FdhD n=1 Tax=Bradyrhizobium sp. S3.9.1 TaxID=3156431 RepID=UPI00339B9A75